MRFFSYTRSDYEPPSPIPHDHLVEELVDSYPYGHERIGMRSLIRTIVWVVRQMEDRRPVS